MSVEPDANRLALIVRAQRLTREGKRAEALTVYRQVLAGLERGSELWQEVSSAIQALEQTQSGQGSEETALLLARGQRLEQQGDLAAALEAYGKALALTPTESPLRDELNQLVSDLRPRIGSANVQQTVEPDLASRLAEDKGALESSWATTLSFPPIGKAMLAAFVAVLLTTGSPLSPDPTRQAMGYISLILATIANLVMLNAVGRVHRIVRQATARDYPVRPFTAVVLQAPPIVSLIWSVIWTQRLAKYVNERRSDVGLKGGIGWLTSSLGLLPLVIVVLPLAWMAPDWFGGVRNLSLTARNQVLAAWASGYTLALMMGYALASLPLGLALRHVIGRLKKGIAKVASEKLPSKNIPDKTGDVGVLLALVALILIGFWVVFLSFVIGIAAVSK